MILRLSLVIIAFSVLNSCSYFFKTTKSQNYYQDEKGIMLMNNYVVLPFDPNRLKKIIDNTNFKYYYIVHCNMYCDPVWKDFRLIKSICSKSSKDSVCIIPVIHDYLNDIYPVVSDTANYNRNKQLFVTKLDYYGRCLNSNKSFAYDFVNEFINYDSIPEGKDVSFMYNDRIVLIHVDYHVVESTRVSDIFLNSFKVKYRL